MALRIGDLTEATSFVGTDVFELSLAGSAGSRRVTGANLRQQLFAGGTGFDAADPLVAGTGTFSGLITGSAGLTISSGTTAIQALTATTGTFSSAIRNETFASGDNTGFAIGPLAGVQRIQYDTGDARFRLLHAAGGLASLEADGVTATTGAFSGAVTISGTASLTSGTTVVGAAALASTSTLIITAAAGQVRQIEFRSGAADRWVISATATAESGGNAGSNFGLAAYTDAGAVLDTPISIVRAAAGTMTLARPVSMSSTLSLTAAASRLGISQTQANVLLNVTGTGLSGEGAAQYGVAIQSTPGSDATTQYAALYARARTATAVYTTTSLQAIFIPQPSLGAGSTVTNLYGLFIDAQSGGGSNYAIYTNAGAVRLGDAVTMTSTLAVTGAITGSSTITGTTITASTAFAGSGTIADAGALRLANNISIAWRNAANLGNVALTLGGDDVFTLQAALRIGTGTFSTAGNLRFTNNNSIGWRNAAGTGNLTLTLSASDIFTFSGAVTATGTLTVTTGGLTVSAGTTAVQALTATTGTFSGAVLAGAGSGIGWTGRSVLASPADGVLTVWNAANTDFSRLQFGGTTSGFPALKRDGAQLEVKLADDSGYAALQCAGFDATTVTASGKVLTSVTSATFEASGATTSARYILLSNTGTQFIIGIESSTGGSIQGTASAYATVISSPTTSLELFVVTSKVATFSDTAATVHENLVSQADAVVAGAGAALGFYGATAVAKQTVTGSRGGNAALQSLLTALNSLGLITDSSS